MCKASLESPGATCSDASKQVPKASYLAKWYCKAVSSARGHIKSKSLVAIRDRLSNMSEGLVSQGSLNIRLYMEALRAARCPLTILEKWQMASWYRHASNATMAAILRWMRSLIWDRS
ncbi:hypothetical protein V6N13_032572 [Hibiscus sabdariffa]|uniref:Uncharacterized protein n=1 Tax=Hibiscus sabdariffa TaxID=183260 RepID=A0ABR2B1L8_9ROSI